MTKVSKKSEITEEYLKEHYRIREKQREQNHREENKGDYLDMILRGVNIQNNIDAEKRKRGLPIDEI